jgi:hypothetical protein
MQPACMLILAVVVTVVLVALDVRDVLYRKRA